MTPIKVLSLSRLSTVVTLLSLRVRTSRLDPSYSIVGGVPPFTHVKSNGGGPSLYTVKNDSKVTGFPQCTKINLPWTLHTPFIYLINPS